MMRRFLLAGALAILAFWPAAVRADISYSYVTDAPTGGYVLSAPGNQVVNLYLLETLTGTSTSLISADGGLAAVAASITRSSAPGNTGATLQSFASTANVSGFGAGAFRSGNDNSLNGTFLATNNPTQTAWGISTAAGIGTPSIAVPDSNDKIFIGSVTIAAVSGKTTFTASGYPPVGQVSGNTITAGTGISGGAPYDLDFTNNIANGNTTPSIPPYTGALANPFTFTVTVTTAVPEPSSILLSGLVVCGGAFRVYRGRLAKKGALASA